MTPIKPGIALLITALAFVGAVTVVLTSYVSTSNQAAVISSSPQPSYSPTASTLPNNADTSVYAQAAPIPAPLPGAVCNPIAPSTVCITSIDPNPSPIHGTVTISGKGFQQIAGANDFISFDGGRSASGYVPTNDTSITVTLNSNLTDGTYQVIVYAVNGQTHNMDQSNTVPLVVSSTGAGTTPTISTISPSSGGVGDTITVSGSNYSADTTARLCKPDNTCGRPVSTVINSGTMQFVVPSVSTPIGPYTVYVKNVNGTSNSVPFSVTLPKPVITAITPTSPLVDQSITITGSNFYPTGNTAFFKNNQTGVVTKNYTNNTTFTLVPSSIGLTPGTYSVTVAPGLVTQSSTSVNPGPATSLTLLADTVVPSVPSGLTIAASPLSTSMKFSWNGSSDNSGQPVTYRLLMDSTDLGITSNYPSTAVPLYTSASLLTPGSHSFKVVAIDPVGNKTNSSGLTYTISAISSKFVSGDRVSNTIDGLNIRNTANVFSKNSIISAIKLGTAGTVLADGPQISGSYTLWHVAWDANGTQPPVTGWSIESGMAKTTTSTTHTLTLKQPSNGLLTATDGTAGDPTLSCGTATGGIVTSVCTGIYPNNSQVTVTALPLAGNYISAWSGACAGNLATYCILNMTTDRNVSVTFQSIPVPTGVSATANNSNSVSVNWTGAPAVNSYTVYRNGNVISGNIQGTSYTDTTVLANTSYNYTVSATINGSQGAQSAQAPVTTPAGGVAAGTVLWAKTEGTTGFDSGYSVTNDKAGNIIVGGQEAGRPAVFKYSASHTPIWTYGPDGFSGGSVQAVATDADGNIYMTGSFYNWVDFRCSYAIGSKTDGRLVSLGGYDTFVVKLSPTGSCMWSKRFGGPNQTSAVTEQGVGIAVDPNDNSVVVTGIFDSGIDFGGGRSFVNTTPDDVFLAKFSTDGAVEWANHLIGGVYVGDFLYNNSNLAIDNQGNIFLSGSIGGTVDLGGGNITANSSNDLFIAKYSSSGAYQWAKHFGDSNVYPVYPSYVTDIAIAVDPSGDVVVAGAFNSVMSFGGPKLTDAGYGDIFIAKYKGTDGSYLWSKRFGGPGREDNYTIVIDKSGNITISGKTASDLDFGSGPMMPYTLGGGWAYLANFDTNGNSRWTTDYSLKNGFVNDLSIDSQNHIFQTGRFGGSNDFGTGSITGAGNNDMFLVEFQGN